MYAPDRPLLTRLLWATKNSLKGLKAAWYNEKAFRIECWLGLILFPVGIWLAQTPIQLALLFSSCLLVLAAELGNSAIEAAVDRIGVELHELSGRAKDLGSAMVMVTMINVILVWVLVAMHRFGGFY